MSKAIYGIAGCLLVVSLLIVTVRSLPAEQENDGQPADLCQRIERQYRGELIKQFQILGQKGFADTGKVSTMLQTDPVLTHCREILNATPPSGAATRLQLDALDSHLLYLSRNLALPKENRFPDEAECRASGFDPMKKGDIDIARQAVKAIWPYSTRMDGTPLPANVK